MDKIEQLKQIIADSHRIVFFGGAGVSTESGIPDFRSESGLYHAKQEYGRSPEEIISYSFFTRYPDIFFDYYKKNMVYPDARPNAAHYALAKLEKQGKLIGVVTQNIDGLHQLAGSEKVYELHGSVLRNTCMRCGAKYDLDAILKKEGTPRCDLCDGIIKPDVILYEEMLDESVLSGAIEAIRQADTLIVGGTSLVVYPAAGLIRYFKGKNLILINKSQTAYDSEATLIINDAIGEVMEKAVML